MSVRRVALKALMDITDGGAYANLCLKEAVRGLPRQDAKWVSAAVYTTLDHLLLIDYMLRHYCKGTQKPAVRAILRMGTAQALYMNVPHSAACNESVKLAKEIGKGALSGFINGVLRALCRDAEAGTFPALPTEPRERLSIAYSYPRWLVDLYAEEYGEAFTESLLTADVHGMTLRAQAPFSTAALASALRERGIAFSHGSIVPDALHLEDGLDVENEPLFLDGSATVQSESAMLVCRALGATPAMRVLDACAAPGGKTAYLSMLMENRGRIDAWELHAHRCELLQKTLARLHVENAAVENRDATVFFPECAGLYDAVLLDAPCSGLGVQGKPDVRYQKSMDAIRELAALQRKLIDTCAQYVKPGGTLLYATCTISPPENQARVREFLSDHAEFEAAPLADCLPEHLRGRAEGGMVQLFPHMDGTEGFFIAKLTRKQGRV